MADRRMYFGTRERMTWIKCPNSGMGRNRVGWEATGTYLNGGGWSRTSATKHFEPSLTWSFLDHEEVRAIEDYYLGAYGQGPIYWLDPFSIGTNVLPLHWSVPRLAADDAPSWVEGRRPAQMDTGTNSFDLPTKSAVYELRSGDVFGYTDIPVPPGYTLSFVWFGGNTGTAQISLVEGSSTMNVFPTTITMPAGGAWTRKNNNTGSNMMVRVQPSGVGTLTVAGMMAAVQPTSNVLTVEKFRSGAGHSGVVFKGAPSIVGYSAPHAVDYQSLSAEFIEVGSWLR